MPLPSDIQMQPIASPVRQGLADYLRQHIHPGGIIVSQRYRFIYMKACRTGGTSILRRTLEQMPLDTFHFKDHRQRFSAWLDTITDDDLSNYQIFTFIRNPWDRTVSIASYFEIPLVRFLRNYRNLVAENQQLLQHSLPCHLYSHNRDLPFVDVIGSFEQIQQDFQSICQLLDIRPPKRLVRSNQSQRTAYTDYFDTESKSAVANIYRKDIELFGYKF